MREHNVLESTENYFLQIHFHKTFQDHTLIGALNAITCEIRTSTILALLIIVRYKESKKKKKLDGTEFSSASSTVLSMLIT